VKYYDSENRRLVFAQESATPDFWDRQWEEMRSGVRYDTVPRYSLHRSLTRRYLPNGGLILEGGCGLAYISYSLSCAGYQTIALDFAPKTIEYLKKECPSVNPIVGDVFNLQLDTESIDGYWSLGVIEHFYTGYRPILKEAYRVLKPGGYLFLTFPALSWVRWCKAQLGCYPHWSGDDCDRFYQFALNVRAVEQSIKSVGFSIVSSCGHDGVKGVKDELFGCKLVGQWLYDSKKLPIKLLKHGLDRLARAWAGHMRLMVVKKAEKLMNE